LKPTRRPCPATTRKTLTPRRRPQVGALHFVNRAGPLRPDEKAGVHVGIDNIFDTDQFVGAPAGRRLV
jgi:hypothetical protein